MADMMDTLKELLGDNADEKINSVLSMLNSSNNSDNTKKAENNISLPDTISPELLMQAQSIMQQLSASENDDRSNLLLSLKPYMRESRKKIIDDTVKFLNVAKISKIFQGGI